MFEQASIDNRGALKSPWALAISITGQTLIISAGVLVSLVHTDVIRPPAFLTTLTVPTGRTPPPPTSQQRALVKPSKPSPGVFMPPYDPKTIDLTVRDAALPSTPDFGPDTVGIPGGLGLPSPITSLIDTIARPPAPTPRTEAVAQRKPDTIAPWAPIAVSTGVQAAKLIRQVKPIYPHLARIAHVSGIVRLVAIIGKDGAIANLQVTGGHPLLTGAAVEAVKQWLYQPTLLNGEPVDVITQIDVNFTLSQ